MNESAQLRDYDLVIWGATGFTGRLVCELMVQQHSQQRAWRWAMAGRNLAKLEKLRAGLGANARSVDLLQADSHDRPALDCLARATAVVLSTVGPYSLYGSELVASCVAAGTDYCDLTGEVPWMRRMQENHESTAVASGARIVFCCGFDSIPSDLGVWFLQQEALRRFGRPLQQVGFRLEAAKGGASGGTVASLLNIVEEAKQDAGVRRLLRDPYALCPDSSQVRPCQDEMDGVRFDDALQVWLAPFVMAGINTRVVHRSNALAGFPYGEDFRYDEAMMAGAGPVGRVKALALTGGLAAFLAAAGLAPTRALLKRFVLPAPGEGPSAAKREAGFFSIIFHGRSAAGEALQGRVRGDRDPGYTATAGMIAEAALCLVESSGEKDDSVGGFWTPSCALGEPLLRRLIAHAGLSFEIDAEE